MAGWEEGYWKVPPILKSTDTHRLGLSYMTVKRELSDQGFDASDKLVVDQPVWGLSAREALFTWQKQFAETIVPHDKVFSYYDSRLLFAPYCFETAMFWSIPWNAVYKLIGLESNFYPAAYNAASDDSGLAQINLHANPNVTMEEAFDARFAINYGGERLAANHKRIKSSSYTYRWWGAIVSHNAPAWAQEWVDEQCPKDGGPLITIPGVGQIPKWQWLYRYKDMVLTQWVPPTEWFNKPGERSL